jgi:hypothetical protein
MTISKSISTLSLAFAMIGGYLVFAPSQAEAANNNGHISYEALKRNFIPTGHKNPGNSRPGQPANKYTRGCSAIQHCRG